MPSKQPAHDGGDHRTTIVYIYYESPARRPGGSDTIRRVTLRGVFPVVAGRMGTAVATGSAIATARLSLGVVSGVAVMAIAAAVPSPCRILISCAVRVEDTRHAPTELGSKDCKVFLESITTPEGKVGTFGSGLSVSVVGTGGFTGASSCSSSTTAGCGTSCSKALR